MRRIPLEWVKAEIADLETQLAALRVLEQDGEDEVNRMVMAKAIKDILRAMDRYYGTCDGVVYRVANSKRVQDAVKANRRMK